MIPNDLISLQKRARLTQVEFCRVLGLSPSKFANIIGTRSSLSIGNGEVPAIVLDRAETLARYLDVTGVQ